MLDEGISKLIGTIYDGVEDERLWNVALDQITQRTGSRLGFFTLLDLKQSGLATTAYHGHIDGRMTDTIADYEQHVHRADPTFAHIAANPQGGVFDSRAIAPAADYAANPYIRWSDNGLGTSHWITAYTPSRDGFAYAASLHTATANGPHTKQDTALFLMLFEHLARAQRIAARPPLLDTHGPALLIERTGRLISANAGGEAILRTGTALRRNHGIVTPVGKRAVRMWDKAVSSTASALTSGGCGGGVDLGDNNGARLFAIVEPMPLASGNPRLHSPAILVRLVNSDRGRANVSTDLWRQLFGLTHAEAQLAADLLVPGATLRGCAAKRGVTYATARVQLARIFAKTEVHSQAELAMLLLQL